MEHKALKYQLKTMIANFSDEILKPILSQLENALRTTLKITILLKSYKCFEAGLLFKEKKITGYGRNETEASRICIKNFLEFLTENEIYIDYLKIALSNVKTVVGEEENMKEKTKALKNNKNLEIDTVACSLLDNKMLNHTKEFGNISSINMIETPQNLCNSIMENDCLLVKMLNNDNQTSKVIENSSEKPKNLQITRENEFRKKNIEKPYCICNHEELLLKALKEISLLNNQIVSLKTENDTLRSFICNKENDEMGVGRNNKKNKTGYSVNPSRREEGDSYSGGYHKANVHGHLDEQNFIAKLQANLGIVPEKFKML